MPRAVCLSARELCLLDPQSSSVPVLYAFQVVYSSCHELHILWVQQDLNVSHPAHSQGGSTASLDVEELGELYNSLLEYGFSDEQLQQALQVAPEAC